MKNYTYEKGQHVFQVNGMVVARASTLKKFNIQLTNAALAYGPLARAAIKEFKNESKKPDKST